MTHHSGIPPYSGTPPQPRNRLAWLAPLLATLLVVPVAGITLLDALAVRMTCAACTEAETARFVDSVRWALPVVLLPGLAASGGLLITSWVLAWQRRNALLRILCALLAVLGTLGSEVLFTSLVDLP